MKYFLKTFLSATAIVLMARSAMAQTTYKEWDVVYDNITRKVMNVDYYKNGLVYLKNPLDDAPWYSLPRNESDLVPRVSSLGRIREGATVSFFNINLKRWDSEKVVFLFKNNIAYINLVTYEASIVDTYFLIPIKLLGAEVTTMPGSGFEIGEKACPKVQTPRGRRSGSAGTIVKLFDNNTALVMYKDFFLQTNYEAIPFTNLSTTCRK